MSLDYALESLISAALEEDLGGTDQTTEATVPEQARCRARLVAKQDGVLSGTAPFRMAFELLDAGIEEWHCLSDGSRVAAGTEAASFTGLTRAVLSAERTAMNFVKHLSGVATYTARFVEEIRGTSCRICDTRKTTPLLRALEKKAVRDGGGTNHRPTLASGILIKENHITAAGGIAQAVTKTRLRAHHLMRVEIEVRNLEEFDAALETGVDVIMLDNMGLEEMRAAVQRALGHRVLLEASGNVSLERVRAVAETGVDLISVGALTHSAPVLDLSLLIDNV